MVSLGRTALRAIAAVALISVGATVARADAGFTETAGRPFAATSVWDSPIRANRRRQHLRGSNTVAVTTPRS